MTKKLTAFLAAWLLVASTFAQAQTGLSVKGRITSADGKPLDGATIYLNRAADSTLVKASLSEKDGSFIFAGLKAADYRLVVSTIGYKTYKSDVIKLQKDTVFPAITLQPNETSLKEVAVTAKKPPVEQLIDRTVVNVSSLPGNAGTTLLDLLAKAPGVSVDDNTISLQGKSSVTIYIDDKPTYLSGDDLANYLRSLPSSGIDRIELMTNPPARYDAGGSGGVINIRTKRNKETGFNGNLNLNYIQGKYTRTNNSVNLNYRQNKLNVSANLGHTLNNNYNAINLNRYFDPAVITDIAPDFTQTSFVKRHSENYSGRVNIDYYATEKTTFGAAFTGLFTQGDNHTANTSLLSSTKGQLDSTITANNVDNRQFKNGSINLNYRHDYDKKGSELTADLDYVTYRTQLDQVFANSSFYPDGTLYSYDIVTGNLPSNLNIYSARTDYNHVLASGLQLSAGVKSSYTKTDNLADYFDTYQGITTPDYNETNHFLYNENINAAYVNANKDFKRFSIQAGLRFENTIANGHQLGNPEKPDSSFSRNYNGFFPTFYTQYKLDTAGKQKLGLNFSRRVDRPNYAQLNPFLSPLDKFTYNTGNPFLLPTYSDNLQLYYSFKGIKINLFYTYVKDRVDGLIQIINGYYYNEPGNIGNSYQKGIEVNADLDPTKWFNIHLYTRLTDLHTVTDFYTGVLNTTGEQFVIRPTFSFTPGTGWTLQAYGNYQTRFTNEQFIDLPRGSLNFAFEKKLSAATTIELDFNDVLHTQNSSWYINYLEGTQQAYYHSVGDSRNVELSFSYRFGKTISNQRKHNANGAQSEENRAGG
jgi:outer membrane receptor protein involved in Fe transport